MVVLVGTLDEVGVVGVDCQLRLTDKDVLEAEVHEDIVGTLLQPVLYTDYLELLGRLITQFGQVLEQFEDLPLLGADLATHQITDFEANQIGRRAPPRTPYQLPIVYSFGDLEEAVDEPI